MNDSQTCIPYLACNSYVIIPLLGKFGNMNCKGIDLSRVSDAILFRRQKWSFQNDHIYIFNQKGMKELRNLDKTWQLC